MAKVFNCHMTICVTWTSGLWYLPHLSIVVPLMFHHILDKDPNALLSNGSYACVVLSGNEG